MSSMAVDGGGKPVTHRVVGWSRARWVRSGLLRRAAVAEPGAGVTPRGVRAKGA